MLVNSQYYQHFYKGVEYFKNDSYSQAINCFKQSIDQNTFAFNAYINLISSFIKQNNYKQALNLTQKVMILKPYNSLTYYNRASVLIKMEEFQQALLNIQCALSCQYLKKYQRQLKVQSLQNSIKFAYNNIQAFRLITIHKRLNNYSKNQIINDLNNYKKLMQFYEANFQINKKQSFNNHFVYMQRQQFYLKSKLTDQTKQKLNNLKAKNLQKILILNELKQLRQQYLKLVKENQYLFDFVDKSLSQKELKYQQNLKQKDLLRNLKTNQNKNNIKIIKSIMFNLSDQENDEMSQTHPLPFVKPLNIKNSNKKSTKNKEIINNKENQISDFNVISKSNSKLKNKINQQPLSSHKITHKNIQLVQSITQSKINVNFNQNRKDKVSNDLSQTLNQISPINRNYQKSRKTIEINKKSNDNLNSVKMKLFNHLKQDKKTKKDRLINQDSQIKIGSISIIQYEDQTNKRTLKPSKSSKCFENHSKSFTNTNKCDLFFNQNQKESKQKTCNLLKINRSFQDLHNIIQHSSARHYNHFNHLDKSFMDSHRKVACSKCHIDQQKQDVRDKNTQIQINLTEIYNLTEKDNCKSLNPYCRIYFQENLIQQTSISQGRFPNWKDEIYLKIDQKKQNQEQKQILIQLWNKNKILKYDQMIGKASAPFKYGKYKIYIENDVKKIAYMYINTKRITKA